MIKKSNMLNTNYILEIFLATICLKNIKIIKKNIFFLISVIP